MSDLPLNLAEIIEHLQAELDTAHAIHAGIAKDIDRLRTQRDAAVDALKEAIEEMEDMLGYVDDYFQAKWGYRDTIERLNAALEGAA